MKKFKVSNLIFLIAVGLGLTAGLIRIFIAPVDINEYENRTAEKLVNLNIKSYLNSNFQNSVELAAGDQLPFAIEIKKAYNQNFSKFTSNILISLIEKENRKTEEKDNTTTGSGVEVVDTTGSGIETADTTGSGIHTSDTTGSGIETSDTTGSGITTDSGVKEEKEKKEPDKKENQGNLDQANLPPYSEKSYTNGYKTYKSQLMYGTYGENYLKDSLKVHADNVNSLAEKHPDVRFTAFFLERETDVNFETGFRNNNGTYLLEQLNLGSENEAITQLDSFETYDAEFYKTDHHWNYKGAYRGYTTVLSMLLPNETPLEPTEEVYIGIGSGSMTDTDATANYREEFWVYGFNYPSMTFYSSRKSISNYGSAESLINQVKSSGPIRNVTYGKLFGGDDKELQIINNQGTGNGNILVIGSSYDNATLKLIASHYDTLYCVDMRYWTVAKDADGNPTSNRSNSFKLGSYIEEHDINTVLFFGDDWFWTGKTFYIYD